MIWYHSGADTKGHDMTQTNKHLATVEKPTRCTASSVLFLSAGGGVNLGGKMRNSHLDPLFREIFEPYLKDTKKDKIICNRCGSESEVEGVAKCKVCGSYAVKLVEVSDGKI